MEIEITPLEYRTLDFISLLQASNRITNSPRKNDQEVLLGSSPLSAGYSNTKATNMVTLSSHPHRTDPVTSYRLHVPHAKTYNVYCTGWRPTWSGGRVTPEPGHRWSATVTNRTEGSSIGTVTWHPACMFGTRIATPGSFEFARVAPAFAQMWYQYWELSRRFPSVPC